METGVTGTVGAWPDGRDKIPLRVLVVEDNRDSADALAQLVRLTGHEVQVAYDGPAALRATRRENPDVVLLDLNLPGMTGFEVAERLIRNAVAKKPFLIAITGLMHDDVRHASERAGIDLHLTKPVDPYYLQEVLGKFQAVLGK